ncbi:TRAP transporter substrate-binding protein [Rhodobacteraceae bacterium N5(2021)]|uniref:TRAP transporter substrate-binding protein n=1 Tax=Gymnodinialimonas phycosphaerae TaxID=2841589 RepID=A0A975TWL1_9RHOB|nr:TRAP transporter substrate-binding protein [Gymnodinialimonas phycosphaerae]MBY4891828.1 TRAP transporter substrate-binding protein [Gymnodinialimonas phycosphaerae]
MFIKPVLAGAAFLLATTAVYAEELKFANFTPPFHTINASVIERLNTEVTAATNGELIVCGYHGGELGAGPVEQYVRALQNVSEITWVLPGYTSSQFEQTMIAELPGAIPVDLPGYEALWAAYGDHLAGEFPGTVPLALWTSEPNVLIMGSVEVRSPADLIGLDTRVAGATAADVAVALGATPQQMPISQVYQALDTGEIDGVITGASTLIDFRLDEVADSITVGAPLGRLTVFTVMNEGVYNGLSDEHRAALDASIGMPLSRSAEEAWYAAADEAMIAARSDASNVIIDLTEEEIAVFAAAVSEVSNGYVEAVGGAETLAAMNGN